MCKWNGRRDEPTIFTRKRKNTSAPCRYIWISHWKEPFEKRPGLQIVLFGVVTTRLGLAARVKSTDFEEVVKLVWPENYTKFLGELWDVSGLPLSWGPDAVTDFLAAWKVSHVKTFPDVLGL